LGKTYSNNYQYMSDRLAIIVPYRDREKHLNIFVPHMHEFLKDKGIDYDIFIVEQSDERPFNYGKLCNSAVKEVGEEYTYFAFHDIDMLPITDECDYSYVDEPTHLATNIEVHDNKLPYPQYFGGVVLINREDFEKVNGYSNEYWGYGFEDLDLLYRLEKSEVYLEKYYDSNNTYSFYDELDILPYRIENVKISNSSNDKVISYNSFGETDKLYGKINPITKRTLQNSFTTTFWFRDLQEGYEQKKLFVFEGFDSGVFLEKGNEIIFQIWDNKEQNYEVIGSYTKKEWNHCVFTYDKKNNKIILVINGNKYEKELPHNFQIFDYSNKMIRVSDDKTSIDISSILLFDETLSDECITDLRNNGEEILDNLKEKYGVAPSINVNYGKKYRNNIVLDNGKNLNHLSVYGELNTTQNHILQTNEVYLPVRLEGEYQSLPHENDSNIIDLYYSYDPDIEENADIFFNEVLAGEVDFRKIGLNSMKYEIMDIKDMETYKLIRVVT